MLSHSRILSCVDQCYRVNGRHIVAVETSPGPDSASTSKMKPMDCPRVPNKRQSSSKSTSTAASRMPPSTSAGKRPSIETTKTWEEWREKSRRLYGTGENSRQKNPQTSISMSNGASASHYQPPPSGRDFSEVPRVPPIPQWDESESSGRQRGPRSSVPILNGSTTPPDQPVDKPSWTSALTGPGSAFLQGPGGPFPPPAPSSRHVPAVGSPSSVSVPPPGRTIYSADSRIVEDTD